MLSLLGVSYTSFHGFIVLFSKHETVEPDIIEKEYICDHWQASIFLNSINLDKKFLYMRKTLYCFVSAAGFLEKDMRNGLLWDQ